MRLLGTLPVYSTRYFVAFIKNSSFDLGYGYTQQNAIDVKTIKDDLIKDLLSVLPPEAARYANLSNTYRASIHNNLRTVIHHATFKRVLFPHYQTRNIAWVIGTDENLSFFSVVATLRSQSDLDDWFNK